MDLSTVMARIEELLPRLSLVKRTPLLALYCIYNWIVPNESRSAKFAETIGQYQTDLTGPSPEALVIHLVHGSDPDWTVSEHETA